MSTEHRKITVWSDGGCRCNPGQGSWGFVIELPDKSKVTGSGYVEHATNNWLEYKGLFEAAAYFIASAKLEPSDTIEFRSDSMLIVQQLNGAWRVKEPSLRPIYEQCLALLAGLKRRVAKLSLVWIPRELNTEADAECNRIMDLHGVMGRPNPKKIRA